MSCSNCTKTNTVGQCPGSLVIGTVPYNSQAMYIYFENLSTGRVLRLSATSSIAGLLTVDITEIDFPANQDFEVHVSRDTDPLDTQTEITIGATEYDCLIVRFEKPLDNEGEPIAYGTQTLTIQS